MSAISSPPKTTRTEDGDGQRQVPEMAPAQVSGLTAAEREARRRRHLAKASQVITLLFGVLEIAIAFRIVLKLIAANPASPFAQFLYRMTELFLAPFAGLTPAPAVNGAVLETSALIAMAVYGALYWLVLRGMWVIIDPAKPGDANKYEPDL